MSSSYTGPPERNPVRPPPVILSAAKDLSLTALHLFLCLPN